MLDREKKVERYTLTFHDSTGEVLVSSPLEVLGHVQMAGPGPLVSSRSGFGVPVHIAQSAAEFLQECLAEQEKLSKFKCEVEYTFELRSDEVRVFERGIEVGSVWRDRAPDWMSKGLIAAARKFAGWA